VVPVGCGIPWLGFVVYPTHRRVKAREVRSATRHLGDRLDAYRAGEISFGEFDASVKGWVNHVRYADTWGLRRHVFGRFRFRIRAGSRLAAHRRDSGSASKNHALVRHPDRRHATLPLGA
jgi:hypothetical protein